MVRQYLRVLLLLPLLSGAVAAQAIGEGLPTAADDTQWQPSRSPDVTNTEPLEDGRGFVGTIVGWIASTFLAIFEWLLTPIAEFANLLLDYVSFPSSGVTLFNCSNGNVVCRVAGILDAWAPVREIAFHAVTLFAMYAFWLPFKLIIKFFIPFLG